MAWTMSKLNRAAVRTRSSSPGKRIQVRVGTSFISVEQARENLQHEIPEWDFQAVQQKLRAQWNQKLSRLQLERGN